MMWSKTSIAVPVESDHLYATLFGDNSVGRMPNNGTQAAGPLHLWLHSRLRPAHRPVGSPMLTARPGVLCCLKFERSPRPKKGPEEAQHMRGRPVRSSMVVRRNGSPARHTIPVSA